jgi:hypothetical protein
MSWAVLCFGDTKAVVSVVPDQSAFVEEGGPVADAGNLGRFRGDCHAGVELSTIHHDTWYLGNPQPPSTAVIHRPLRRLCIFTVRSCACCRPATDLGGGRWFCGSSVAK